METEKYPEISYFEEGLSSLGLKLSEEQLQQFIDYYELLVETNKVMNLTAITELKEVIIKHFIDSLSLVKLISLSDEKVIDVGTGAGFPGIPLKIIFPDVDLVLLDSLQKRLRFLDEVTKKLNLRKVQTLHGRAEDYGRESDCREKFDLCVSRAVAKLSTLSEYCIPFIRKGGIFIAYKSGSADEEAGQSKKAIKLLGASIIKTEDFMLYDTDIKRTLILIKKKTATPAIYPRSAGKPVKSPL